MNHRDTEAQSEEGPHVFLTERIIGCAIEVHRHLGPGLLEKTYESALSFELRLRGFELQRQVALPLFYKGQRVSEHRLDLIVNRKVIVEVKTVAQIEPIHVAQVLTYLRAADLRVGLILNFHTPVMARGVKRVAL